MTHLTTRALLSALLGLGLAGTAAAQQNEPMVERGTLTDADDKLEDGSPYDQFTFDASAGDQIVVEMTSTEVDTYLALDADQLTEVIENDDMAEGVTNSRIEYTATRDGEFAIIATCFNPDARGAYTVTVTITPGVGGHHAGGQGERVEGTTLVLDNTEPRVEQGTISDNDPIRAEDDRPYDAYTFVAEEGERIAIDLRSEDLDPYLSVMGPQLDEAIENDDYNNSRRHSRVEFVAPAAGEYTVHATCFDKDDRGAYTLSFGGTTSVSGELTPNDPTLPNGEHIDWYDVTCEEGQLLMLQIDGEGFDTYLILEDPTGSWEENDDHGNTRTSRIETNIFQPGEYRVGVTSFEGGETGTYTLSASTAAGYLATRVNGSQVIRSEFDGSEPALNGNGYVDAYAFEAEAGNTVILTLESDEVDTVLKIKGPGQLVEMNDDYHAGDTNSQMAFRVAESGTYYVTATTFRTGETGGYALTLDLDANKFDAGEWAIKEGGQVYGVFVGINDYPGENDLAYCDADATRTARVFTQHFDMDRDHAIILTNDEATIDGITQAIQQIGAQAGPDDMFVFFYSGHGDQVRRIGGADIADPDGNNETLSVYDGDISDDDFANMLDHINAGTTLVVVDACYSGGFAKDIVTKPGRIGLFSSEGDCLSMVAEKYQAGGYLSLFFTDAFNKDKELADLNGDQMLTAHELTFYLQQRFDEIVRSGQRGRTSRLYPSGAIDPGNNLGYQRIISDRDGVSPHIILLDW
ncbi:MAG: caspase family protein [Phycisphaerales bacterium JB063]